MKIIIIIICIREEEEETRNSYCLNFLILCHKLLLCHSSKAVKFFVILIENFT